MFRVAYSGRWQHECKNVWEVRAGEGEVES